ncbi:hypothetical protein Ah1_00074 [Aeromonas phage Ah1]|uniref:Uncharacterized protein n=1 Tax=Aeromonas phage Ah1 TaxID=2053701 RepID=A0A2H4YF66_9CAUD|nr:hypothetical protein KNT77_gp074 [Aeromonas phage Ah1]AUE22615.1 hypothetical protein Ah1_00074 [Aeromonas phage Ah1]
MSKMINISEEELEQKIEDKVEEYLKSNLDISMNRRHGYYNDVTLEISIKLNGNEIASATEYL